MGDFNPPPTDVWHPPPLEAGDIDACYTKDEDEIVIPAEIHGKKVKGVMNLLYYPPEYVDFYILTSSSKKFSTYEEMEQNLSGKEDVQPIYSVDVRNVNNNLRSSVKK